MTTPLRHPCALALPAADAAYALRAGYPNRPHRRGAPIPRAGRRVTAPGPSLPGPPRPLGRDGSGTVT